MDETTAGERHEMMALALVDGWGEEWQEIVAAIHNSQATKQEHLKIADDFRRFKNLEPAKAKAKAKQTDWAAQEAAFASMIMRGAKR